MKLIYTLTSLSILGLSSFASAGDQCNKSCDKAETTVLVKSEKCSEGSCDKSVAVKTGECSEGSCDKSVAVKTGECSEGSCDKSTSTATYVVTGMSCGTCSDKLTTTLTNVDGVTVKKACHKSGNVVVNYDEAKTDKTKVQAAIASTGLTVAGEKLSIPVSGMSCITCSDKLTAALTSIEGCTVGGVCHKSGHAIVTIDPAKTSEAKVIEVIQATGLKVTDKAEKKVTTTAKQG